MNKKTIRGQTKIFSWRVKLNWKIGLTEEKTNKKNESQIEKIKTTQNLIERWKWKPIQL